MNKRLAVKLQAKAEKKIKQGHPWVFSDSITKLSPDGKAGDLAIVFDHRTDKVIAVGLYDPASPIRIKILYHGGPTRIDDDFFREKIEEAFEVRKPLFRTGTNAYRLLFGENDGFPGMVADIYNLTGVVKIYSEIWFPYLEEIIPHIVHTSGVKGLILRLSRNLQNRDLPFGEGDVLVGELKDPEVEFQEYGVRFRANVLSGHKTGFFLDHRANRHRIGELATGKSMLDVFSYAGGFSVHALAGGAAEVVSVDVSDQALELARLNASLNPHSGRHYTIQGDAFEELEEMVRQKRKFDIVVVDPPSFAKKKEEILPALRKYGELAALGARLTRKGGLLMLASCSSRVSMDDFSEVHQSVFDRMGIKYFCEEITEHDIDHPITFPEGAYLKSVYYRM